MPFSLKPQKPFHNIFVIFPCLNDQKPKLFQRNHPTFNRSFPSICHNFILCLIVSFSVHSQTICFIRKSFCFQSFAIGSPWKLVLSGGFSAVLEVSFRMEWKFRYHAMQKISQKLDRDNGVSLFRRFFHPGPLLTICEFCKQIIKFIDNERSEMKFTFGRISIFIVTSLSHNVNMKKKHISAKSNYELHK